MYRIEWRWPREKAPIFTFVVRYFAIMAMREMIEPRNETGKERGDAGDGLEKQLPTINKKNWFDGRETSNAYVLPPRRIYLAATLPRYRKPYNIYAFDGERINISRTASPLTPDPVAKRPPLRDHWSYITHIPLYAGIKAEESNAKYYPFPRPYPIKWKSSIWIFMNIAV